MNVERFIAALRAEQAADRRLWMHALTGLEMIEVAANIRKTTGQPRLQVASGSAQRAKRPELHDRM